MSKKFIVSAIQEKLSVAQARLVKANSTARDRKAVDSEGVLRAIEDIQKSLDTQIELLKTFPNLAKQARSLSFSITFELFLTIAGSSRTKSPTT